MRSLRVAISVGATVFMATGYFASVISFLNGTASVHAARMDSPPVRFLSAAFLAVCLVLAFIRSPDGEET